MDNLTFTAENVLPLKEVKKQISNQLYYDYFRTIPRNSLDDPIEDDKNHGVPMMNEMFYTMCLRHHHLPSWTSFIDEYKEHWCYPIGIEQLSFKIPSSRFHYSFSERALDRKLINAYMSFLKEYYALHWFWNIGFTAPYWSLGNDKIGYDIVATNRFSHVFGIKIYSNTETARFFARVKAKSRNHLLRGSTSVSITSSFGANSIKLGDTYLFTDHILNAVYHYINDDICKDIIL